MLHAGGGAKKGKIRMAQKKSSKKTEKQQEHLIVDGKYGCPIPSDKLRGIPLMNLIPCRFHPILSKLPRGFLMFAGYACAGGLATLVDLTILFIWTHVFELSYHWGVTIGYGIGTIVNFTLQKLVIFGNKSTELLHQFGTFCLVAVIGLGLTQLLVTLQVEGLKVDPVIAKAVAVPVVLVFNFLANKRTTFTWFK